jgi:hypothetical protein
VKLVPAEAGICGFIVIRQAKFFSFSIEERFCVLYGAQGFK